MAIVGGAMAGGDRVGRGSRWLAGGLLALPQLAGVVVGAVVLVVGLLIGLGLRDQCLWDRPCTGAAARVRGYGGLHLLTVLLPVAGSALAGTVALVGRAVRRAVLRRWSSTAPLVVTALATALAVPVLLVSALLLAVAGSSTAAFPVPVAAGTVGLVLIVTAYPVWAWRLSRTAATQTGRLQDAPPSPGESR